MPLSRRGPDRDVPAIELRDLVKEFPGSGGSPVRAVAGVDLTIPQGQIVAFLGPNGAGKTTTVDMILGLIDPDSGSARVLGRAPRAAVRAGLVSAVLQSGGLLGDLTVREIVRLIASTFPESRSVDDVMRQAGLEAIAGRRIFKCSGGEQQRVRFALALLPDPHVLLLDEPTAGMDVTARHQFWETMRADADTGRTVMFATHYLEEADAFAERIVLIQSGRIVADGSVSEIRARGAGRTLSVDVPAHLTDDRERESWIHQAETTAGLHLLELRAGRAAFTAPDTDAAALALLTDLGGSNLEIAPPTLDSAFVALTGATAPAARGAA